LAYRHQSEWYFPILEWLGEVGGSIVRPDLKDIKKWLMDNRYFFIFFTPLFLYFIVWWLAFYPGTLSPDSLSQWTEAKTGHLSNASPFLYAYLLSWLIKVMDSPAVMGLFQLTLLSALVSFSLNYAVKSGLKIIYATLALALFIIMPQFGIFNVTIWKDVLYAYSFLGLLIATFIFFQNPTLLEKRKQLWTYALIIALVPLMRFNGMFVIPLVPLLFFATKGISLKKALMLFLASVIIYGSVNYGLASALSVKKAPLMVEGITVKAVGAIYHMNNPRLTSEEREIFNHIIPEERWRSSYSCQSVDELFYRELSAPKKLSIFDKGIDPDPEIVRKWRRAVFTASLKNPEALIFDKACLASYLFGVKGTLYKYELYIYQPEGAPFPVEEDSKIPTAKNLLIKYLRLTSGNSSEPVLWTTSPKRYIVDKVLWGAWLPTILFFVFLYTSFRRKYWATFSYALLVIANLAATAVLVPAGSFRYIYALYVALPLLPIFYLLEKIKKDHKSS
jgi:hypothetical protein